MKEQWVAFWNGSTMHCITGATDVTYDSLKHCKSINSGAEGFAKIAINDGVLKIVEQVKNERRTT